MKPQAAIYLLIAVVARPLLAAPRARRQAAPAYRPQRAATRRHVGHGYLAMPQRTRTRMSVTVGHSGPARRDPLRGRVTGTLGGPGPGAAKAHRLGVRTNGGELEIQVQVARHLATQADCQYPGLTLVTVAERPWPGKLQLGWPALGLAVKAAAAPSAAE